MKLYGFAWHNQKHLYDQLDYLNEPIFISSTTWNGRTQRSTYFSFLLSLLATHRWRRRLSRYALLCLKTHTTLCCFSEKELSVTHAWYTYHISLPLLLLAVVSYFGSRVEVISESFRRSNPWGTRQLVISSPLNSTMMTSCGWVCNFHVGKCSTLHSSSTVKRDMYASRVTRQSRFVYAGKSKLSLVLLSNHGRTDCGWPGLGREYIKVRSINCSIRAILILFKHGNDNRWWGGINKFDSLRLWNQMNWRPCWCDSID